MKQLCYYVDPCGTCLDQASHRPNLETLVSEFPIGSAMAQHLVTFIFGSIFGVNNNFDPLYIYCTWCILSYALLLYSSEAYQGQAGVALISSFEISDCPWPGCTWMHLGSVAVRLRMRGKALQMQQLWFQTSWACRHKTSCRLPASHGSSWTYEDLHLHSHIVHVIPSQWTP